MATFQEIRERVESYLLDDVPETNALIPAFVNDAVRKAEEDYNLTDMKRMLEVVTIEGARVLEALPADWKQRRDDPWVEQSSGAVHEIQWAPSQSEMLRQYGNSTEFDSGSPRFVLEEQNELWVYPLPDDRSSFSDGDYRLRIPYWGYSPELASNDDENYMTRKAEWYLIYYAVAEGFLKNQDERQAAIYQGKAAYRLQRFVNQDKRARLPRRMTLAPRRDVFGAGKRPRRGRL
jgi:hypothetical protein